MHNPSPAAPLPVTENPAGDSDTMSRETLPSRSLPGLPGLPGLPDLPNPQSDSLVLAAFHEILTDLSRGKAAGDKAKGDDEARSPVRNPTLTLVAQKASLLTDCASAIVALLDESRELIVFAAAAGDDAADLVGSRVRASDTLAGNTARTGEPYWAFRPGAEPSPAAPAEILPFVHSAAVVPIFLEGQPIGAIAALHKRNHLPFDGADLMTLSTLAAAASLVIGSQAIRAERAQQKRELDVLYEAVRNVSGALSAPDVLRVVVEQVAGQMESSAVVVWLLNDERTHLSIAEDEGLTPDEREITLPVADRAGSARWAASLLRQTRPVFIKFHSDEDDETVLPSATNGDAFWTCESPFPALAARSGLACPIRSGDTVRGLVLVLSVQAPGVYQATDAKLIAALASQAAVALENADLYEDATRRAQEAAVLYDLSQTVTSSLHLPDVLHRIGDTVLSLLGVDTFALFLHDSPTDRLVIQSSRNLPIGARDRYAPLVGQGVPGWVMEFETPASVADVAQDIRNASAPINQEGVASLLAMPLQIGSATIGVLCAMTTQRRAFSVAETELAYTIANQAALAIENARIYESARQKKQETRLFFMRLARALNAAHVPDEIPPLIASLTQEVMEADRCTLYAVQETEKDSVWDSASDNGDGTGKTLKRVARFGFSTESEAAGQTVFAAAPNTPAGWIACNNHPLVIENLDTDDRFAHRYDKATHGQTAAYLGVPMRHAGRVIGVIEVVMRRRRKWQDAEMRLLLTFATQAATAFQNAQMAQIAAHSATYARCSEHLHLLSDGPGPASPDAIVSALALELNAPVAVLYQSGPEAVWQIAASSVAPDALPLPTLAALLDEGMNDDDLKESDGFAFAVRRTLRKRGKGAIAVVVLDDFENTGGINALLNVAVELLTLLNEAETTND